MNNKEIATIIFVILIILYIIYIVLTRVILCKKLDKDMDKFNKASEEIDSAFGNEPITKE